MEKMRLITTREKSFPTRARETFFLFSRKGGRGEKGRWGEREGGKDVNKACHSVTIEKEVQMSLLTPKEIALTSIVTAKINV